MSELGEDIRPPVSLENYRVERRDESFERRKGDAHGLTGLPYETSEIRKAFFREVEEANKAGRKVSVGFLDMDGLGGINNRFGHEMGNKSIIAWVDEVKKQALEFAQFRPQAKVYLMHLFEHRGDELRIIVIDGEKEEEFFERINGAKLTLEVDDKKVNISGSCAGANNMEEGEESNDLTSIEKRADLRVVERKAEKMQAYFISLGRVVKEEDFTEAAKEYFAYRKLSPDELELLLKLHKTCVGLRILKSFSTIHHN